MERADVAPLILDLGTRFLMVRFTLRPLYLQGENIRFQLDAKLVKYVDNQNCVLLQSHSLYRLRYIQSSLPLYIPFLVHMYLFTVQSNIN